MADSTRGDPAVRAPSGRPPRLMGRKVLIWRSFRPINLGVSWDVRERRVDRGGTVTSHGSSSRTLHLRTPPPGEFAVSHNSCGQVRTHSEAAGPVPFATPRTLGRLGFGRQLDPA